MVRPLYSVPPVASCGFQIFNMHGKRAGIPVGDCTAEPPQNRQMLSRKSLCGSGKDVLALRVGSQPATSPDPQSYLPDPGYPG